MKRNKRITRDSIIHMAKSLESGDKYFKIDSGSMSEALIAARYYIEHGMSADDYKEKCYQESDIFLKNLFFSVDKKAKM
jgi:hypothetical protein